MATSSTPQPSSAIGWFTAWFVTLGAVYLLSRTNWGRPIVYYVTWLAVVLLILGHSGDVVGLINGGATTQPPPGQKGK